MIIAVIAFITTSCSRNETAEVQSSNTAASMLLYYDSASLNYSVSEEEGNDEFRECEDLDMSAQVTYYTSDGNYIYVSRDEYGNISGYDINGNYISGYSDQFGNTTIHDINGNYVYSYTDGYGNTTSHDMNGNYSYSYTDDYGNTSGHDMNGNYYSAYTDDFGYTTITSY